MAGVGAGLAAERDQDPGADLLADRERQGVEEDALQDGAIEQARGKRRHDVRRGVVGAGGLAGHRDAARISVKGRDVLLHPPHHGLLVQQAVVGERVPFVVERGIGQEAEEPDPVVQRDNDLALVGELGRVI